MSESQDDAQFRARLENHFALYRLNLRSPVVAEVVPRAWYRVDLLLVNELGLFRRADLNQDNTVKVDCKVLVHENGQYLPPDDDQFKFSLHGLDNKPTPGFHGAGKGGLEYAIESNGPLTFYLLLSSQHRFARGASIVPLMVGPIHLVNKPQPGWNTNLPLESWPDIPSTAHDTYRLLENVVVHETWDAGIPGKIWDSALVMLDFIKKQQPYWQNLHVIDLSAGTGLLGIYLGKLGIQATITELDDAVNLIYENKALNGDPSAVNVKPLLWGDESQAAACGKADIIVASDVLYETEFFEDLAQALVHLCKPTTVIYIGYKRRGLDNSDEERFWSLCRARGFDISVQDTQSCALAQATHVQIFRLQHTPLNTQ